MTVKCIMCDKYWNVSKYKDLTKDYICPECATKIKKENKDIRKWNTTGKR